MRGDGEEKGANGRLSSWVARRAAAYAGWNALMSEEGSCEGIENACLLHDTEYFMCSCGQKVRRLVSFPGYSER